MLADALPREVNGGIVDPAAGTGALLVAAEQSGRRFTPIALDSDPAVVSELRRKHPAWVVSAADSLSPRSRSRSRAWRFARSTGVEWVLLNPPFSYRGGPAVHTTIGDFSGRVSPSAQFLAMALNELQPRNGVVAVLPDGVVRGDKYDSFWEAVCQNHKLIEIADLRSSAFHGVRAHCRIVKIERLERLERLEPGISVGSLMRVSGPTSQRDGCRCIEVIRGRIPRHVPLSGGGERAQFIHTTDVLENLLRDTDRDAPIHLATPGPAVILPRIGKPQRKIATIARGSFALSDCLIALRPLGCRPEPLAEELRDDVDALARAYRGTGAPYVTVRAITTFLLERGWHANATSAAAAPGACTCGADVESATRLSLASTLSAAS